MPSSASPPPTFEVYAQEPIARTLARLKLSPVAVGILFFLTVSLPLTIWASMAVADRPDYVGYFENISWSVSILTVFPLLVGTTLKYYQDIPELLGDILAKVADDCPELKKIAFRKFVAQRFGNRFAPGIFLLITLFLNYVYFRQLVLTFPGQGWITDGNLLRILFGTKTGLSALGVYASIVQVLLIYWVFNAAWNTYVVSCCLHRFFSDFGDHMSLEPLHPDRCCGLRRIGSLSMVISSVVFLLGLYLSLKVIDKIVVQGESLFVDIGNPLMLSCYAIVAPLVFFLPLSSAHKIMQRAKDSFLLPMARSYRDLVSSISGDPSERNIERAERLGALYFKLRRRIPVWPFDFRSLQAFFGAVIVPILPVALPFAVQLVQQIFGSD
jgi:hypothetical protein